MAPRPEPEISDSDGELSPLSSVAVEPIIPQKWLDSTSSTRPAFGQKFCFPEVVPEHAIGTGKSGKKKWENGRKAALTTRIHRHKLRQHKYKVQKKTSAELFDQNADIRAGPEFKRENSDDTKIQVTGGDDTVPIIRDFGCFLDALQENLEEKGYEEPTLIQKCVIPIILKKKDYDLIGRSLTGTGKTGAFLFPLIHLLEKRNLKTGRESPKCAPHAIIICPTRELAKQIGETAMAFSRGTSVKCVYTFGEIKVHESMEQLGQGCDILVATMGRLNQFVREEKVKLNNLEFLVLDEADRLAKDSACFQDLVDIVNIAREQECQPHRTLLFSATFEGNSGELAKCIMRDGYFTASVATREILPSTVKLQFYEMTRIPRVQFIIDNIFKPLEYGRYQDENGVTWLRMSQKVLIFCNTRRMTNWLACKLSLSRWRAIPTNGDRSQMQRQEALDEFEKGKCDILVSTSVTSRGLNLVGVQLVINFEMPKCFEDFVHKVGRTGRAGNAGDAITFFDKCNQSDMCMAQMLAKEMTQENMEVPSGLADFMPE